MGLTFLYPFGMPDAQLQRMARDLHMLSALTQRVLEEEPLRTGGVTFPQLSILKWLDAATPRRAQGVAKFLGASAPAATQILARLRKKGLIRSRPNAADRRAGDLFLTPRARRIVREYEARKGRLLDSRLRPLPFARREEVVRGLETAIELLLSDPEAVSDLCLHCGVYDSPGCVLRRHGYRCPTEAAGGPVCGTVPKG